MSRYYDRLPLPPDTREPWLTRLAVVAALVALLYLCLHPSWVCGEDAPTVEQIDAAILSLLTLAPNHPMRRHADARRELAVSIDAACRARGVPAYLVVAVFLRESSFKAGAVGALGEVGLGQLGRYALAWCEREGLVAASVECPVAWLGHCYTLCGKGWPEAVTLYATGRTCTPDTDHVRRVVKDRMDVAGGLKTP